MSIVATDVKFYLTGGTTNANPNLSLGGLVSTTQVGGSLHGLFNYVTPDEAVAGSNKYRAIEVKNTNVTDTLYGAVIYIAADTTSASTTIAIGYDSVGTQSIINEDTAPAAVTFSTPLTKVTAISLGDMAPGAVKRIWLKRTVTAGAVKLPSDTGQLIVTGGTI